jgi:hypothetical protein
LPNVDEIKNISEGVNGARWVEVMINMGDHFKAFAIETMFFDEEVGDRGLAIVGNNFLPPDTCSSVESRRDEGCGFSRPERRATQASIDDFLGVGPRLLVRDVLDTHIGGLILDRDQRLGGSGQGEKGPPS